ncbi:MAG: hypothetical protein M3O15_02355 [Acidobacteriota bacterium]|nr:hypothetical protein [Acidobacteriota bacterium]
MSAAFAPRGPYSLEAGDDRSGDELAALAILRDRFWQYGDAETTFPAPWSAPSRPDISLMTAAGPETSAVSGLKPTFSRVALDPSLA